MTAAVEQTYRPETRTQGIAALEQLVPTLPSAGPARRTLARGLSREDRLDESLRHYRAALQNLYRTIVRTSRSSGSKPVVTLGRAACSSTGSRRIRSMAAVSRRFRGACGSRANTMHGAQEIAAGPGQACALEAAAHGGRVNLLR